MLLAIDVCYGYSCSGVPDGKYPIRDTFKYLLCQGGQAHVISCPSNEVYIHRDGKCRTVTDADKTTFCLGLPNNDYRDPWDCHKFFKCYSELTYLFDCQLPSLVFNPENDQCVYSYQYPCTVVHGNANAISDDVELKAVISANNCTGKADGDYVIADVFQYLECKSHVATVKSCPNNQIFVAVSKKCSPVTIGDEDTFCDGRENGNYRNPWNCHHFISCVAGHPVYDRPCHPDSLIYDPNTDRCEYESIFPCKNITGSGPITNRCTGKKDGKYVLRDVFKYLKCTGGKETIVFCPVNQVYIASEKQCRVVTNADKASFCNARPTGNYRNPWNCHNFLTCAEGHPVFDRECYPHDLVYDADNDRCEHSNLMHCVQVQTSLTFFSSNRCTGKPDGLYPIPDVFQYIECKSGIEMTHSCPVNQIFVAKTKACSTVTTAHLDVFCDARPVGNYRNPWNCHHFITCDTGHPVYDRICHPITLVYDPNNDRCEYKEIFPCKQISSGPPPTNRCTGKPDGIYILSDVFKYLECKGGIEILHFCPKKQVFMPDKMKCRSVTAADKVTFCNSRPVGNYRNPWNCHHFITCDIGHPVYDRPCHPLSLVFDPDNNRCEYDTIMTCETV